VDKRVRSTKLYSARIVNIAVLQKFIAISIAILFSIAAGIAIQVPHLVLHVVL